MLEQDVVDPFEVLGSHEGLLYDYVRALIHLQLALPYTNRPDQDRRQRVHGGRAIGIRAPRDASGQYTWAAGTAGRIILHQLLDHIRKTGCTALGHDELGSLFENAAFGEETCLRQVQRLAELTIEVSNPAGSVIEEKPVGVYGQDGLSVSPWLVSAVRALPSLPSPAAVHEVSTVLRWRWHGGRSRQPISPMPVDLLLWMTYVAPQVRDTATVPLTVLQQHIGTDTTAKKQSVYFLGLELKDWLPGVNAQFPDLSVTLTETALVLAVDRRCDVAVYGVDSAIGQRFRRLRP